MQRPIVTILLTAVLAAAILTGCQKQRVQTGSPVGHFTASPRELCKVASVAFVELDGEVGRERVAADATAAIFAKVQDKRLFDVEQVARNDRRCENLPLDQCDGFTLAQLRALRRNLGCDAVLLGRLYDLQVPPRMRVSLELVLLDLKNGCLLWRVDHTWDTTDAALRERIHDYFEDEVNDQYRPMNEEIVRTSPRAFAKFVAHEACRTLPSRRELEGPPPPQPSAAQQAMEKIEKCLKEDD